MAQTRSVFDVTDDPAAWRAADMRVPTDWQLNLTEAHRTDLCRAVEASRDAGLEIHETTRESFSLPRTARVSVANPVVADIDNDGAAEIVVVSSEPISADGAPVEPSAGS